MYFVDHIDSNDIVFVGDTSDGVLEQYTRQDLQKLITSANVEVMSYPTMQASCPPSLYRKQCYRLFRFLRDDYADLGAWLQSNVLYQLSNTLYQQLDYIDFSKKFEVHRFLEEGFIVCIVHGYKGFSYIFTLTDCECDVDGFNKPDLESRVYPILNGSYVDRMLVNYGFGSCSLPNTRQLVLYSNCMKEIVIFSLSDNSYKILENPSNYTLSLKGGVI